MKISKVFVLLGVSLAIVAGNMSTFATPRRPHGPGGGCKSAVDEWTCNPAQSTDITTTCVTYYSQNGTVVGRDSFSCSSTGTGHNSVSLSGNAVTATYLTYDGAVSCPQPSTTTPVCTDSSVPVGGSGDLYFCQTYADGSQVYGDSLCQ
jgi:hypothetical protein